MASFSDAQTCIYGKRNGNAIRKMIFYELFFLQICTTNK